jgi:hypothetical protein
VDPAGNLRYFRLARRQLRGGDFAREIFAPRENQPEALGRRLAADARRDFIGALIDWAMPALAALRF